MDKHNWDIYDEPHEQQILCMPVAQKRIDFVFFDKAQLAVLGCVPGDTDCTVSLNHYGEGLPSTESCGCNICLALSRMHMRIGKLMLISL